MTSRQARQLDLFAPAPNVKPTRRATTAPGPRRRTPRRTSTPTGTAWATAFYVLPSEAEQAEAEHGTRKSGNGNRPVELRSEDPRGEENRWRNEVPAPLDRLTHL